MKKTKMRVLKIIFLIAITSLHAQSTVETVTDTELLGLLGDNLDLYATLDLFQKSKTIEEFETSLNDEKTGINNLDLNLDGNVDFIKIATQQEGADFTFVLQVDVLEKEVQDVAVILVAKDKKDNVTVQMIGDENLYGKDYIIEPKLETTAVTANPAYTGSNTVVVTSKPSTVVIIESEPIIRYVYSSHYLPYYSPYYYGYYPVYYRPYPVISINIYGSRYGYYHINYYGGHRHHGGNTLVINNTTTYNKYSKTRNTSNSVHINKVEGNYKRNNYAAVRKSKNSNNKSITSKNKRTVLSGRTNTKT